MANSGEELTDSGDICDGNCVRSREDAVKSELAAREFGNVCRETTKRDAEKPDND